MSCETYELTNAVKLNATAHVNVIQKFKFIELSCEFIELS